MEYSKKLPIATGLIFIFTILASLALIIIGIDMTYTAAILIGLNATAGSIFLSNIVWYSKKAQAENTYKLKINSYTKVVDEKIRYLEESLKLQQKYKISPSEMEQKEYNSPMTSMESEAINSIETSLDSSIEEATSPLTTETV